MKFKFILPLLLLLSCKTNENDVLINKLEEQIHTFQNEVNTVNVEQHALKLDKMSDEIGETIETLSKKELSADQIKRMNVLISDFQVTLITVEDQTNDELRQIMLDSMHIAN